MNRPKAKICFSFVMTLAAGLFLPSDGFAYIDPGTVSMLLQLLLGGTVGLIVAITMSWSWLCEATRRLFRRNLVKANTGENTDGSGTEGSEPDQPGTEAYREERN